MKWIVRKYGNVIKVFEKSFNQYTIRGIGYALVKTYLYSVDIIRRSHFQSVVSSVSVLFSIINALIKKSINSKSVPSVLINYTILSEALRPRSIDSLFVSVKTGLQSTINLKYKIEDPVIRLYETGGSFSLSYTIERRLLRSDTVVTGIQLKYTIYEPLEQWN